MGREALSAGYMKGHALAFGGYKYLGNAFEIFEKFNQKYLPFYKLFDDKGEELPGSLFGSAMGGMKYHKQFESKIQPGHTEIELHCSLTELFNGCLKSFSY